MAAVLVFPVSATACDTGSVTCFDGDPPMWQHKCEAHLKTADAEAFVNCYVELNEPQEMVSPVWPYDLDESAPAISPTGRVVVNVTITRNAGVTGDVPWNLLVEEDAAGVTVSGDIETSGTIMANESTAYAQFVIAADPSSGVENALVGVAFWGTEHKVQYGYLGVQIDRSTPPVVTEKMLVWIAGAALLIALVALLVAILAWVRAGKTNP